MVYLKKNQKLKAQILFIFKADIEESAGHCLKEIISQQNKNNNKNYINGKKPQERFNNRNNNNQATTKKFIQNYRYQSETPHTIMPRQLPRTQPLCRHFFNFLEGLQPKFNVNNCVWRSMIPTTTTKRIKKPNLTLKFC